MPITISGPASLVDDVRAGLQAIIATKKSKSTQRVKEVPTHVLPFISSEKPTFDAEDITVSINDKENEVVVAGEREAVGKAIEAIKARVATLTESLESQTMTVPKRQHRLFHGPAGAALLAKTRCAIIPVASNEPGDEITIWGLSDDIPGALGAVFEQARSKHAIQVPLPGSIGEASQIRTYITRSGYMRTLAGKHSGAVDIYVSPPELSEKTGVIHVDFIGEDKNLTETVKKEMGGLIKALDGSLREVEIDWLSHKTLIGRNGKKSVYFPIILQV